MNQWEWMTLFFLCSLQGWSIPECDWPDVLTDPSVEMGPVFPPRLKRGQGSRHLGVDITFSPDEEDTVCDNSHRNKYFSSSGDMLACSLFYSIVYVCILLVYLVLKYILNACVRSKEVVVDWMLTLIDRWGSNQAHFGRWTAAVSDGQWHGRTVSHTSVSHLHFQSVCGSLKRIQMS